MSLRRTSYAIVLTLTAGVLAGLPVSTATASSAPRAASGEGAGAAALAPAAAPRIRWAACGGYLPSDMKCGKIRVPLDYDNPRGPKVAIALIKRPANDPAQRQGSILLNPGGPGGSGVGFVAGAGDFLFTKRVRTRFDLVGFDPRGIARSRPLRCFGSFDQLNKAANFDPFPRTPGETKGWFTRDDRFARACRRNGRPLVNHMSTANVARDMDRIRAAVGDRKLNFVGYSYGSIVGSNYANLFPDKVGAVVIDGVLDPSDWATGNPGESRRSPSTARIKSNQGTYETLEAFWRLCDQAGRQRCAFANGSPERRYKRIAEELRRRPVSFFGFPFGYRDLVGLTTSVMYDGVSWPFFAQFLRALDEAKPRRAQRELGRLTRRLAPRQRIFQTIEGFPGVLCADTSNPTYGDAWVEAGKAADRQYPYFGRLWTWASSPCRAWPGKDSDRYTGPWNKQTSAPVLVVQPRFDPATSYQQGAATARRLGRAYFLEVRSYGHTSLFVSRCATKATAAYLLRGALPQPGKVCKADFGPFSPQSPFVRKVPSRAEMGLVPPPNIAGMVERWYERRR